MICATFSYECCACAYKFMHTTPVNCSPSEMQHINGCPACGSLYFKDLNYGKQKEIL